MKSFFMGMFVAAVVFVLVALSSGVMEFQASIQFKSSAAHNQIEAAFK